MQDLYDQQYVKAGGFRRRRRPTEVLRKGQPSSRAPMGTRLHAADSTNCILRVGGICTGLLNPITKPEGSKGSFKGSFEGSGVLQG